MPFSNVVLKKHLNKIKKNYSVINLNTKNCKQSIDFNYIINSLVDFLFNMYYLNLNKQNHLYIKYNY